MSPQLVLKTNKSQAKSPLMHEHHYTQERSKSQIGGLVKKEAKNIPEFDFGDNDSLQDAMNDNYRKRYNKSVLNVNPKLANKRKHKNSHSPMRINN